MLNFFNLTYTCDVEIKINSCYMPIEQEGHIFIDDAKLYLYKSKLMKM